MATRGVSDKIPTFSPTWEEFKDFYTYIKSIQGQLQEYGICKVIPPKEFIASRENYNVSTEFLIDSPIRQVVQGKSGTYHVTNVVEKKTMSVENFFLDSQALDRRRSKRELEAAIRQDFDALQRSYWSNISFLPPLYGADSVGTLFDKDLEVWNLNKLQSLLSKVKTPDGTQLPGVTTSMLYFGQWKSTFAWHVEDMNLFSINFVHFGQQKQWYGVPPAHADHFERVAQSLFPTQHNRCPEFLRHKEAIISPAILARNNIPVYSAVQNEHEFMITFPRAYHSGFNYGFNCAESVNFATEAWIPYGRLAMPCMCLQKFDGAHDTEESVSIDMKMFDQYADADTDTNTKKGNRSQHHHSGGMINKRHASKLSLSTPTPTPTPTPSTPSTTATTSTATSSSSTAGSGSDDDTSKSATTSNSTSTSTSTSTTTSPTSTAKAKNNKRQKTSHDRSTTALKAEVEAVDTAATTTGSVTAASPSSSPPSSPTSASSAEDATTTPTKKTEPRKAKANGGSRRKVQEVTVSTLLPAENNGRSKPRKRPRRAA
jgi:hypothetical protein